MNSKYKKMLLGMAKKEKKEPRRRICKNWLVYILKCQDGSLYTGITNNLERRLKQHNNGTGARYTRLRRPVVLVYSENRLTRSQALIRECAIKSLPRIKKEKLMQGKHGN